MGLGKLVAMVPAMHGSMYSHKLLQDNLKRLTAADIKVLEPKLVEGKAKLPGVEEITNFVIDLLGPNDMAGMRVLITAGPTIEHIDPIKFITNKSSGKMGIAVARAAASRGADVTLVYGPGTEEPPAGVKVIRVKTTAEMRKAFVNEMKRRPEIVVSTAAPQDFVVAKISKEKLRHYKPLSIKLIPAPRVVDGARELAPKAFIVGFKAEHDVSDKQLKAAAIGKLREGEFDMVIANDVSRQGAGFGVDTNEVEIVTSSSSRHLKASKADIAKIILDAAIKKLRGSQR
jgi:phosphopantothenoylcysteine decarboxylase/phosphopantothenate--cysteine ligase